MKDNFKIISLVIFGVIAIIGLLTFSGYIKIGKNDSKAGSLGTVVLWGTQKTEEVTPALEQLNLENPTFYVTYIQKSAETFDQDLLEALASGTGPDLFFLSSDLAYKYSNKIFTIPYKSYPVASFKQSFAGAGEVFLTSKGILAFPLTIDPLVTYYNRSILDANNIIYPPTYWDELEDFISKINKKNELNQITQSAISLGQFSNINNAKDIITTLFMQAGNKITFEENGRFYCSLDSFSETYSLDSMIDFYTDFSDSTSSVYSWNRSLPNSLDFFSSGNLALYFGFASELKTLINRNPNQDFLVSPMLQLKNANSKATIAKVTGIAISSSSKNFNTAFIAASLMATGNFASSFANSQGLVPARRDLLAVNLTDAYFPIFYSSALYAKSWLDPEPIQTNNIFSKMVDNVLSNTLTSQEAIKDITQKINLLLIR
jgi:multiple sugar transport system substrate-binding protein